MLNISTETLALSTKGFTDIIDITAKLQALLSNSQLSEGNMLIFVSGSTAALTTIEYEKGLKQDLKDFFEQWIPMNAHYYHNALWQDGNGYAHLRAAMLKPSLLVPFTDKHLCLGTWQQVILVDFDNRPRHRNLSVQLMGKI